MHEKWNKIYSQINKILFFRHDSQKYYGNYPKFELHDMCDQTNRCFYLKFKKNCQQWVTCMIKKKKRNLHKKFYNLCYKSSKKYWLQLSFMSQFYAIGKLHKLGVTDKQIKVSSAWLNTSWYYNHFLF